MDEGVDDGYFQEALWGMMFNCPAIDTNDGDVYPDLVGGAEQPGLGGLRGSWNNGASVHGPSDSGLLSPFGAVAGIPPQVDPSQSVARLGSADGSQVAIEAL